MIRVSLKRSVKALGRLAPVGSVKALGRLAPVESVSRGVRSSSVGSVGLAVLPDAVSQVRTSSESPVVTYTKILPKKVDPRDIFFCIPRCISGVHHFLVRFLRM